MTLSLFPNSVLWNEKRPIEQIAALAIIDQHNNANVVQFLEISPELALKKICLHPTQTLKLKIEEGTVESVSTIFKESSFKPFELNGPELLKNYQQRLNREKSSIIQPLEYQIKFVDQQRNSVVIFCELTYDNLRQFFGRMSFCELPKFNVNSRDEFRFQVIRQKLASEQQDTFERMNQNEIRQQNRPKASPLNSERSNQNTTIIGRSALEKAMNSPARLAMEPQIANPVKVDEKVMFYKGPCKSVNIFSVLDSPVEGQKTFNFVEKPYRDMDHEEMIQRKRKVKKNKKGLQLWAK